MKPLCPKNCEFRFPGCHSHCQNYAISKKALNDFNAKIKKEKAINDAIMDSRKHVIQIANQKRGEHNV